MLNTRISLTCYEYLLNADILDLLRHLIPCIELSSVNSCHLLYEVLSDMAALRCDKLTVEVNCRYDVLTIGF